MRHESDRVWDGRAVTIQKSHPGTQKTVYIEMTETAARDLANAARRLQQTSLVPPETVDELATALDYVLVGDPSSRMKHKQMEAAKGMTPDGGYKIPHMFRTSQAAPHTDFCTASNAKVPGAVCGAPKAEHNGA